MNAKKNPEANLERLRLPLFLIGLTFAASFVLTAFEWRTFEPSELDDGFNFGPTLVFEEPIPPMPVISKPKPSSKLKPSVNGKGIIDDLPTEIPLANSNSPDDDFKILAIDMLDEQVAEEPIKLEDENASFPGGLDSLSSYLSENIRYPRMARENGVKGTVYVEFIVSEDGEVSSPKILRGLGFGCDDAAIDLVDKMPRWNPARQNGKRVPVTFRLPVKFTLQ